MNNIKEILDSMGLENNESIVYLEAIRLGTVPASIIANKLNMARTTIRYACESLVKKGLLISTTKGNTKLFTAEHPNKIKNLLQIEKNKLEQKENKLNKVMSQILQMYNPYTKLPKVTFYEGEEGIKKVLWDSLNAKEKINAYVDVEKIKGFLNKVNTEYVEERKKRNIKKRTIYSDTLNSKKYLDKFYNDFNNSFNETKFLDTDKYNLFISFMAYDGKVAYITLEEGNYVGVLIENQEIYNFHKNIFQFMWDHLD